MGTGETNSCSTETLNIRVPISGMEVVRVHNLFAVFLSGEPSGLDFWAVYRDGAPYEPEDGCLLHINKRYGYLFGAEYRIREYLDPLLKEVRLTAKEVDRELIEVILTTLSLI